MSIIDILRLGMEKKGSDILLIPGAPVCVKINGNVEHMEGDILTPEDTLRLLKEVYDLDRRSDACSARHGDDDFSFSVRGVGRFRCNAYQQRNSMAMVLRIVSFHLPDANELHIPDSIMEIAEIQKGLVLVTGPAGSGKSTTLACIIDRINRTRRGHIITLEDPIEYIHPHRSCVVSQREILHDTENYETALRAALRQAPDVILIGEMRDLTTIQTALTAAETGQLVLSTLHTVGAAKTIDRIIDVFPAAQQQQIRVQLAMVLKAVVSQQLLPTLEGGRVPAFEIMKATSAIQNMIRESKVHQMDNVISADVTMRAMDVDLLRLFTGGHISAETTLLYAMNPELMSKRMAAM